MEGDSKICVDALNSDLSSIWRNKWYLSLISVSSRELWEMNKHVEREEVKRRKGKKKQRERELGKSEKTEIELWFLEWIQYNTSYLYINELTLIK